MQNLNIITPPKQSRSPNRKQEIILLALELLQTQGFGGFSYQDLASRLGITKASIHHHYPKKADLGLALVDWIMQWHEENFHQIREMGGTAWDKLTNYQKGMWLYAKSESKICPLSSLQVDLGSLPEKMKEGLKQLDDHELAFITDILQQGQDAGVMAFDGEAKNVAILYVLALKGALQYARVHGREIFKDTMDQFRQLLLP